jgi:hypothetical protein
VAELLNAVDNFHRRFYYEELLRRINFAQDGMISYVL